MPSARASRCKRRGQWIVFRNAIAGYQTTAVPFGMGKDGAVRRVRKAMGLPKDPAARRARASLPRASRG